MAELERLVDEHPYEERLWGQLMVALYRAGRQADALETYQRVRRLLANELGLEPGEPLTALQQQILDHDAALLRGEAAHAIAPGPSRPRIVPCRVRRRDWSGASTSSRRSAA